MELQLAANARRVSEPIKNNRLKENYTCLSGFETKTTDEKPYQIIAVDLSVTQLNARTRNMNGQQMIGKCAFVL